ncbi:MAG TPA: amino acid adenylation domain-containing protein, partial [Thermoanaerobaculia bacterium]|nr:amino acid adenylation domain-containing protein [Thermoanaerobaculia bacterium]
MSVLTGDSPVDSSGCTPDAGDAVFVLPASYAQQRLWFLDQLDPESPLYGMPFALRLRGPLETCALTWALGEIVRRHETLRTTLAVEDGEVVQVIAPPPDLWKLPRVDLDRIAPELRWAEALRLAAAEAVRPFDLERGPLLRTVLYRIGENDHLLSLNLHHAIADGWSLGVLGGELAALYGAPEPLPELPIQYADFAAWQRGQLAEVEAEQLAWWRERLRGAPEVLELPLARPRPAVRDHRGGHAVLALPAALNGRVKAFCRQEGVTRFLALLTAFEILLRRTTGQGDLVIGTPLAGRELVETEGLIGLFANVVALRTDLAGIEGHGLTVRALLARVRDSFLGAHAHQTVPFERLVEELQPERSLRHAPLVQALFTVHEGAAQAAGFAGLVAERLELGTGTVKYDLALSLEERDGALLARLDFAADILGRAEALRLLDAFGVLLDGMLRAPERLLWQLPLAGEETLHQALAEWNEEADNSPWPEMRQTIHALFAAQARATPDAVAVESEGERLTYRELNQRANRLAHRLRALGVGPDTRVGVCLNRSLEAVVAILAVLKAGGGYVPLEPAYPRERLAFLLADAGAPVLLTAEPHLAKLNAVGQGVTVIVLDREPETSGPESDGDPPEWSVSESLAYVVYTSGSTGRPKGVAVPHRAVVRLVRHNGFADLSAGETWLHFAPIAFDASTLEIWGSLLNGARLVVFPSYTPSLAELAAAIEENGVTSLWLTAGLFHQMVEGPLDSLRGVRQLLAGGDVLSPPHVEKVLARFPDLRLINGYGPTENTTFTCCHRMQGARETAGPVPIGRPVAGTRVLLLDDRLRPVLPGVPGELCAGGAGLSRGYLNRPELTAEKLVPDPFAARWGEPGARLYRTGDLARHLPHRPDGTIEFLGRVDHQVKLRGFRIELGEIEAVLCDHPAVREAAVLASGGETGNDKRLVAFVAVDGEALPDLRAHLRERLPDYMVPAAFVRLEALPLNANSKVDRRRLLELEPAGADAAVASQMPSAPRSPLEELVAGVWCEVLKLPRVQVDDDFFALGGHSLLATQVVSRLREVCGVELPLRRLFEAPTVAGLAACVEAARYAAATTVSPIAPISRDGDLPASFAQERLWFLEQMGDAGSAYNLPVLLTLRGPLDAAALTAALGEIVRRHEALRTVFRAAEAAEKRPHPRPLSHLPPTPPPGEGRPAETPGFSPLSRGWAGGDGRGAGGEGLGRAAGTVWQVIAPPEPVPLPIVDLLGLSEADTTARHLATDEAARPFDLRQGPLLRALLLRTGDDEHRLVLAMHHIVSDGWSMGVLVREVAALYEAFAAGRPSPLPALAMHYADFAVWQWEWLRGEALESQIAFWRCALAGLPPVLDLPTDRPRPTVRGGRSGRLQFPVPGGAGLAGLARRSGTTVFMALLAVFQTLLARWSGSDDLAVGSPIANRNRAETEPLIGFFVNTLVLRGDLSGGPTFSGLLRRVRETLLDAYAHQDLPFEKVVEALRPERALSHAPLFQVMLILQNAPLALPRPAGLEIGVEEIAGATAKFDLTLSLVEGEDGLRGVLEFDRDLFDEATAERLLGHYLTLLGEAVADPERRAAEMELLSAGERAQLLKGWNDTAAPFHAEICLHERFAAQVARTPKAVALVAGEERISYGELERRADRLAQRLRRLGVGSESRVGVALERTPRLLVALLAVLKAGGAYVPLDPAYPRDRLAFVLADAQEGQDAPVLLAEEKVLDRLPPFAGTTLLLDEEDLATEGGPLANEVMADNLAYLIYTSGSTGRPKGVAITHRSVAALLDWAAGVFPAAELAGVLAATSITFDLSVFELFLPLTTGGTVILAADALELPRLPARNELTLINTVPSAMAALVRAGGVPAGVRTVNLAGEALKRALVDEIYALPGVEKVFNLYGPSEDTTYSTWALVPHGEAHEPTIGAPIANTQAHIVDRSLGLLPVGVPGELCLGGEGLARGYLNRPELTAEKFIPDPFSQQSGRLYRTGDLVRRRAHRSDIELEFLGRIDHQVKVRGFRIELGEVEATLLAHPEVAETVVVAQDQRLIAYVSPGVPADVKERLRERLPDYMIPSAFVGLPELPRTPNGKVNRKALPAPEQTAGPDATAPRTPMEELVAGIWCEVLHLDRVGPLDDFFALGGHSLLATQVVSRLREVCGVELPLRALFEAPALAALAARVEAARRETAVLAPPIVPVSRESDLPASFAQERLWFLEQLGGEGTAYNLPAVLSLRGPLDPSALEAALSEVVRRHEALRTVFRQARSGVVQVITPPRPVALPRLDLRGLPSPEIEAGRLAIQMVRERFDLAQGPLLRALLLRLAGEEHRLVLSMHHIVSDGWSMTVLLREAGSLYGAAVAGLPSPLPELRLQYADFAVWQRRWLQGETVETQLAFWRQELVGAPSVLDLSADRPRPAVQTSRGAAQPLSLPPALSVAVRALSRRAGATPFMCLLAAWGLTLGRHAGQEDLLIGSPIAGRTRREIEDLIGFFVNTLVLRVDGRGAPSFGELLRRVRRAALGAFDQQDLPFERLVEELVPARDLSRSPLFQVLFVLQNAPARSLQMPGLSVSPFAMDSRVAKLDLTFACVDAGEGFIGALEHNTDLFDGTTAARLLARFGVLLAAAADDPEQSVQDLPLLAPAERHQALAEWNDTAIDYPREASLPELFAAVAGAQPDAPAVISDGADSAEEGVWSYRRLDAASDRLAGRLVALGTGLEAAVGLCMERSPELIVGVLAILKAGGVYVPLDPAYPDERLDFMLADTGAGTVLVHGLTRDRLAGRARLVEVEEEDHYIKDTKGVKDNWNRPRIPAESLAYVIYTSGSTGRPKGVAVPHRAIVRLVRNTNYVTLGPGDRTGHVANISFDAATYEIWGALLNGGAVVVIPREVVLSPADFAARLREQAVTSMFLTSALFTRMAREAPGAFAAMRELLVGGEAVDPAAARAVLADRPPRRLLNGYGPTESTTFAAWHPIRAVPEGATSVPVGRPLANTALCVLDRAPASMSPAPPAPPGAAGELCIGGDGLARGYLNRPELTAERFIPDPLGDGGRLYRTGDLVRQLPDGTIEYLGRLDDQVKIRGFRIEPGEIEAVLGGHPEVGECAVVANAAAGEIRLVAYAVGREGQALRAADLRSWLQERLPDYMLPAAFVTLGALPLTANGKLDRRALPAPEWGSAAAEPAAFRTPRTPLEELVAGIWCDVLRLEQVGPDGDFFALGGHSLLATQVVSRLREVCGVEISLRRLFEAPTVAGLAAHVEAARQELSSSPASPPAQVPPVVPVPRDRDLPASFAQERLWFLERLGVGGASYLLPNELRLRGRLDDPEIDALSRALNEVVRRHEVLRTSFALTGDLVVQTVAPVLHLPLPVIDLAALPAAGREKEADALARREARRPFDLARMPLLRATLLRLEPEEHALLLTLHHIVSDGWSTAVMLRETAALYTAFAAGTPSPLAELPVQYADFAAWQRGWLQGDALAAQISWWRTRLAEAPAVLELPTDRPRPAVMSTRGARRALRLPAGLAADLAALSRRSGATPFMVVLAAFQALLCRSTGLRDVPVGSPIAGRSRLETEPLIGLFVNTLVLRTCLADAADGKGKPSFADLVRRAREVTLDASAHQDLPFEKLVEALRPQRDTSHTPLFQVMLIFQNTPRVDPDFAGLRVSGREVESGTAKFDLTLAFSAVEGTLGAVLEYNRDLFDAATATRLLLQLEALLTGAAADPECLLFELPLLPAGARHQLLREWNDTALDGGRALCLHQPFEAQAARRPEATALVFGGERVSYGELNRWANRLAHRLLAQGVGPGRLVGVHLDRGPAMAAAVLAVHKAGGAYVPLETTWPPERIEWILERHGIAHLLTGAAQIAAAGGVAALPQLRYVVCADRAEELEHLPTENPPASAGPEDLAYIIFTSGSTGKPKGVMVRHRPAVNLIDWVNRRFAVGADDRLLFITALSFDLSVYDLFGILAAGGTVRIASALEARDPDALVAILCGEGITFWDSAPAALQNLAPRFPSQAADPAALRLVFLSGDWIPLSLPARVRAAFPNARVISLGGATEATIWSNWYPVGKVDPRWASIPYGRPIDNALYHVLGDSLEPCPVGVTGDLYIGGGCLSDGYAGAPELTAERYLPDPFSGVPGARLYWTGDRARHWPDGELEFLGRVDTQVKVRGFRIELGEIESVLTAHPAVREAVVLAREDTPGDQRLVAYFIPAAEPGPTAVELRRFVQLKVPEYMVPSAFVLRQSWPVSPTGKLDRRSLPPPERGGGEAEGSSAPPRDELEQSIAAIWCELIGRERVGIDESFFEAGGHSLLMARVQSRLETALGRSIPLVQLFQHATIRTLAVALRADPAADTAVRADVHAGRQAHRGVEIAIVGMAGRFPGAATLERFWRNLRDGVESIRFFSDEELLAAGFPARMLDDPQLVKARGALDDPDLFDAAFFDVPPREAQIIDPQQRLFLECAWEALERAGYGWDARRGRVGVFAGATENTYILNIQANPNLIRTLGRQQISIANNHDYLPTRVSFKLNLRGPSVNVQSACSTSLVAVHLACQSLLHGDCDMALAGGASVQGREVSGYLYAAGGISSPDGHTRTFDAAAQGVVGGSGVGVVLLKRLDDAVAAGDPVLAVIRGSASNNDGTAKVGFTAPSVEGQAAAIRAALAAAAVDPASISYVEAHGTGTALGDPVEIAALNAAFGQSGAPHALGSVKTNIGHLDAASGAAGLIKTVLALGAGEIPPSLHFERPNPQIDFGSFFVNARLAAWPGGAGEVPRRAGVSSFGIGGTNAHAILEEAPAAVPSDVPRRPAQVLVLSAKTAAALDAATANLAESLKDRTDDPRALADVAFTLAVGRQPFRRRRMIVCAESGEAAAALGSLDPARVVSSAAESGVGSVAFLFPGQGAQHVGMAGGLYRTEPVFRAVLDRCCDLLAPELGLDLRTVLFPAAEKAEDATREMARTAVTQPALFAVEYALARLWMAWGVKPAAFLGHSIGEYVAACLAGVFTLDGALRLVAARGRLMDALPAGAMLAVPLPEAEIGALLGSALSLAAVNSPKACVVSGPAEAVVILQSELAERGLETRLLHTSHAFHSAMMEPALEPFTALVRQIALAPPRLPFLSNVTGTWITPEMATDPAYWARHLRAPVRFADGLAELLKMPLPALLEVGPGRTLCTFARQHPDRAAARLIVPSLGRSRDSALNPALRDGEQVLGALGRLWLEAVEIDWDAFYAGERRRRVPLPTYPFERRSFWIRAEPAEPERRKGQTAVQGSGGGAPLPAEGGAMGEGTGVRLHGDEADEDKIATVWRDLLGVDEVRSHDDFFDLGGSSLMAIQLGSRLREVLGVALPSDFLLQAPTVAAVAALAAEIRGRSADGGAPERPRSSLVRLQAGAPGRRPLFLVHQVGGHVFTFRALARE